MAGLAAMTAGVIFPLNDRSALADQYYIHKRRCKYARSVVTAVLDCKVTAISTFSSIVSSSKSSTCSIITISIDGPEVSSIEIATMRKAPRYFPRPWNDGDTLGQAFAELTLQDIYRAMRVCRAWHWIIHNTNLRCLTFIDPLPKDAWPAVQWNQIFIDFPEQRPYFVELRRRPFTVNPILDRTWIFRDPAMTTAPGPADITLSESPGRTKGAVTVPELPLENLLEAMPLSIDFRALLMKGHDRLTPQDLERLSRSGWHTHSGMGRGPMYGQLVDIRERYFARIEQMYTLPAAMLCEQDEHGVDVLPQESWKRMFLTQPPVNAVAIKHPTMPVAWKMEVGAGVRIYHVLQVSFTRPPFRSLQSPFG